MSLPTSTGSAPTPSGAGSYSDSISRTASLAPPAWPSVALARTALELRLFFRERDQVIFTFLYPIAMMLIFGSVFRGQEVAPGVTFPQYFLAGIAATGIMLTSFQSVAITIAIERDQGDLARLRTTPMPPVAYFVGKAGLVLMTSVTQLALLLAVARFVFAIALPTDPSRWLTFAWVALLGSVSGTVLGILVSSLPKSGKSASNVVTPIALVLQFFSGVFFVYATLPAFLQQLAALFPLKWMTQGMRSVFLPDQVKVAEIAGSWEHGKIALVLVVWTIAGLVLSMRTFRWHRRSG